jgi:two-component system, NtrC family, response regulator HydG
MARRATVGLRDDPERTAPRSGGERSAAETGSWCGSLNRREIDCRAPPTRGRRAIRTEISGTSSHFRIASIGGVSDRFVLGAPRSKPLRGTERQTEMTRGNVLVVDDDVDAGEMIAESLRARGFRATPESDPAEGLADAISGDIDVVLTDLQMRSLDGLTLCQRVAAARPHMPVIVITGHASIDAAIGALRAGAFDFIVKPVDVEILALTVERAVRHSRLANEVHQLRTAVAESRGFTRLLGDSPAMRRVYDIIARIAPTQATVLVTGESGTGKELVARAIHEQSSRASGPFVAINCAAVPGTLLESELFGHAKGAFTDASTTRRGLFLEAQGGTLFLDEIGEMPLDMQVKLLRALQERTVRPVGGNSEAPFDARVITATNRVLEHEVEAKRFREDLFYRVNVCSVEVPPLRQRGEDVPLLARAFAARFAEKHEKAVKGIVPAALAKLVAYEWPGNVRELENGIERAVAMAQFDQITVDDLPAKVRAGKPEAAMQLLPATIAELTTVDELEHRYMQHVLGLVNGNKSRAARILGFDRRTLYRKLERLAADASAQESAEKAADADRAAGAAPVSAAPVSPPPVAPASVAPPAVAAPAKPSEAPRARPSVLVVDDDADSLEVVQLLLESRGYAVRTATGIAEAMRAHGVDVVLTDLQLNDGAGSSLVGRFGAAPVLAMSGSTKDGHEKDGFVGWLEKPVSVARLTTALEQALGPSDVH